MKISFYTLTSVYPCSPGRIDGSQRISGDWSLHLSGGESGMPMTGGLGLKSIGPPRRSSIPEGYVPYDTAS